MTMAPTPVEPPGLPRPRAVAPDEVGSPTVLEEYLALSGRLKLLRGVDFEMHAHPAVVLDRATAPGTLVWGWWADVEPKLPCLLWAGERGWSATVVEAGALDTEGYERAFWSHRITLLDLALANAVGPFPTLEQLELSIAAHGSFGFGRREALIREAVLWGVGQVHAVQARRHRGRDVEPVAEEAPASVDEELTRHGLAPTYVKTRRSAQRAQEAGLEALLRAVHRTEGTLSEAGAGTRRPGRPAGTRSGR